MPKWKKGECGNPNGRPRKPEAEILRNALTQTEKDHGMHLIEHCVKLAFKDTRMAEVILKKVLPDLTHDEGFASAVRTFLIRAVENTEEKK